MRLLRDASPGAADTVDALSAELVHRGAPPPTAAYAVAAVAWACGMPPGSAAAILLISRTVGWIAHAIEEHRRPTPYRPRLAYTGQPPGTAAPRRTLDAVQGYLAGPQAR
jgi:citrate synthase